MKYLSIVLLSSVILFGSKYDGSTTSAVTLVGGIIKSTHVDLSDKKYKRKDCPVCKGTGKYLSGDGIKMVDCGYCEPEKKESQITHPEQPRTIIKPIIISPAPQCTGPNCRIK